MQPSRPRAQTTPSAKCSRKRAGSVTRFLSSNRCSNSPRSTHDPRPRRKWRSFSQCAPLYPTAPHIATPKMACGGGRPTTLPSGVAARCGNRGDPFTDLVRRGCDLPRCELPSGELAVPQAFECEVVEATAGAEQGGG